jgi:hypothetical protein
MGAWDGTCGFHNSPSDEGDHWPLGSVAFRCDSADLHVSAKALHDEADLCDDPERAEILLATARWYDDLALDLAEIRALPEDTRYEQISRSPFD